MYGTQAPQGFHNLGIRLKMKIVLKAIVEEQKEGKKEIVFYQFYGCKKTADFFTLMGRSRLYSQDISRAIKFGIEVEIIGVSGEDLSYISRVLDMQGLMCNSFYTISVRGAE